MSYFADMSKRRHVTLIIIEGSMRHGRLSVIIIINGHVTVCHYNDTRSRDVTKRKHNIYSTLFLFT